MKKLSVFIVFLIMALSSWATDRLSSLPCPILGGELSNSAAETETPGYVLLSLSTGTDIQVKGKKMAEFYITADNLLNKAYQNHLSRLKYADENVVTGRRGVYNMGRNITFKVVVPIVL